MKHERPGTLDSALTLLQADNFQIVAGGTDFYPSLGDKAPKGHALDITAIDELNGLSLDETGLTINALCSWSDIVKADLPPVFKALQLAAVEVGSVQIQNRATVVGNLCNASPAADGVPPLLCVDASVNLVSRRGQRSVPLAEFIQGSRRTKRTADEIVTSVFVPAQSCGGHSDFLKLGARKYLVISIAMIATRLVIEEGHIKNAAIAIGSCSEVATRVEGIEAALTGMPVKEAAALNALPDTIVELNPIDDVRATKDYRHRAAMVLFRRSLTRCINAAGAAAT